MKTLNVDLDLVRKYNVPGPRYTSYLTMCFDNNLAPATERWHSKTI
jgi:hypothetical protein